MAGVNQDELKMNVKLWLKANGFDYAWLAERCFVTEATVRNWMAKKPIPAAKEHIIRELIKQLSPRRNAAPFWNVNGQRMAS